VTKNSATAKAAVGIDGKVGAKVEVFGKKWLDWSTTIPLASREVYYKRWIYKNGKWQ
jgi:hypothetical protein